MSISAAIFDFDGTLVDTMPLHFEAYRRVFEELGMELTRDDFFTNIGGKAQETIPRFLRGRTPPISVEEIHRRKKARVNVLFESADIPVLETAKLVPVFEQLMPVALASSGSRAGIEILLERLAWRGHFKAVVCGEDAARGKPAPDLFLLAAKQLGADPLSCLVFEDTDDGVAAAKNAGMQIFDIRKTVRL